MARDLASDVGDGTSVLKIHQVLEQNLAMAEVARAGTRCLPRACAGIEIEHDPKSARLAGIGRDLGLEALHSARSDFPDAAGNLAGNGIVNADENAVARAFLSAGGQGG